MQEWQRPRKSFGLRSRGYVGTTTSKYGIRLSTKSRLRLLQYSGRQRLYTTLPQSEHLARLALRLMPPPRWQKWARPVQPRPQPSLTLLRWLSSRGLLKRRLMLIREWPLMPLSPLLALKINLKRKRCPLQWIQFQQLSHCLPRVISRAKILDLQRQHSPNLPRVHQRRKLQ